VETDGISAPRRYTFGAQTVSFIDFVSLCRINSTWKIVNKTFAHVGSEPPA